MGTWGSGIFDNDSASDYLIELTRKLCSDVESDIANVRDGVLERSFPASIGVLRVLAEVFESAGDVLVEIDLRRWESLMDAWFREVLSTEAEDAAYWIEYRDNVKAEMAKLRQAIP